jgi:hypothetical protein
MPVHPLQVMVMGGPANPTNCNRHHRALNHARRKAGLCVDCDTPAEDGKARCAKHLRNNSKAGIKRLKRVRELMKKLHVCTRCLTREAIHGKTKCGFCEEELAYVRTELKRRNCQAGMCGCGRPREDPEFAMCRRCRQIARITKQRLKNRDAAHENGTP